MEEALRAHLLASAALKALCPKVVWDERPQGTYPATTLTLVSPGREYTHDGFDGLSESRVQADVWSLEKAEALAISRALVAAIEPTATIDAGPAGKWEIGPAFLDSEDGGGTEDLGGGTKVYRRRMDWIVTNRPLAA